MEWINRTITDHLKKTIESFPAVLITGPRQVGKSSLLQTLNGDFEYISFDNPITLDQAKNDPELFFLNHSDVLILDEIQYAPDLFPYFKIKIDEMRFAALLGKTKEKCLFLLSGSQTYHLMQNVSESLAGRLAILPIQGVSFRERKNVTCSLPFVPDESFLSARKDESIDTSDLWEMIHRGSMPRLVASSDDWETYYSSYVSTYIERDVNQLTKVSDRGEFVRFMSALASRSGELLNYDNLSREIGISAMTVKRWTQILETSGIITLLQPYHNNHLKRMIKTPKVYFSDTGLLAWLTRWLTPDTIRHGAKAGQFFETWVVSEVVKSHLNAGKSTRNLYFYRDADQREIDLIIENGRTVHPVEIKLTAKPAARMAQAFHLLEPITAAGDTRLGDGAVINQNPEIILLEKHVRAIPVGYL
ncbi:MAG: ATP-binding protein [Oscillospiraceae bacterium]|nr:ATP-binding protein [Oscillospiraceae bacterium]